MCKQTCLGPSYGDKITQLVKLNQEDSDHKNQFVAFSTKNKVIGVIKLPLTGSPNNTLGLISNPGQINCICASKDGRFLLTAGDNDLSMNIWEVDYQALRQNQLLNLHEENPLDIYPNLLDGGEQGELYRDLKDYFYYSQIRKKEENTTKAHKLDGKIPLKEIPNLMIALGHYPSLQEIQNMKNEVKYSKESSTQPVQNLSLKKFVKLFINHKSPYGLTREYIEQTLAPVFVDGNLSRTEFLDLIKNYGENFSDEEIKNYLNVLVGDGESERLLPETIDVQYILEDLLGFEYEK